MSEKQEKLRRNKRVSDRDTLRHINSNRNPSFLLPLFYCRYSKFILRVDTRQSIARPCLTIVFTDFGDLLHFLLVLAVTEHVRVREHTSRTSIRQTFNLVNPNRDRSSTRLKQSGRPGILAHDLNNAAREAGNNVLSCEEAKQQLSPRKVPRPERRTREN